MASVPRGSHFEHSGGLGAVTREFTTRGEGRTPEGHVYSALCRSFPSLLSHPLLSSLLFRGKPPKRRFVSIGTSSWGSGGPFSPGAENRFWNPKVPETLGTQAKTLILSKSCRSVPPTPGTPRADREGRLTGTRPEARFLHHRATPSSRLVRVDGSRKLPQIT